MLQAGKPALQVPETLSDPRTKIAEIETHDIANTCSARMRMVAEKHSHLTSGACTFLVLARLGGTLPLFSETERAYAAAVSRLAYCNPFTTQRMDFEREALHEEFVGADPVW